MVSGFVLNFEIESKNTEIGENTTLVSGALSGENIGAYFNYKYILDCFQSITGDSLSIELSENKPMIIRGVGDNSFMYLIMPMNR
jgi:DNA polymerase III sliding clamp (beta) subunit (PCNA family)